MKKLLTEAEKNDLKARGFWGDFLALREKQRQKGVANALAERDAYNELLTLRGIHPSQGRGQLPVAPPELAGKEAAEPDVIRWVARNIDNPEASPATCPDPFAWTLLRQSRENQSFVTFFIEKLWSKLIPSKAQVVSQPEEEMDGKETIDYLDKIRQLGGRPAREHSGVAQEEACVTHAHEVAGSTPAPAPTASREGGQ